MNRPGRNRRLFLALTAVLLSFGVAGSLCVAQTAKTPTLRERLIFGLLARLPSELAFVDAVVEGVETGTVPAQLVDRTFFWARSKSPQRGGKFTRRPIIYFQPALEIQLDRLGIDIATPRLSFLSRRL
ncbi:MAG: hypothetical protein AAGG46_00455 [Planctomycetota bacterium]